MDTPKLIEIADVVRLAHLATFQRQLSTGMQLRIAGEIIDNEEAPAYVVVWSKCARKCNANPTNIWLSHLPMIQGASNEKGTG